MLLKNVRTLCKNWYKSFLDLEHLDLLRLFLWKVTNITFMTGPIDRIFCLKSNFLSRVSTKFCYLNFFLNQDSWQSATNFNSTQNIGATAFLHFLWLALIAQPFN